MSDSCDFKWSSWVSLPEGFEIELDDLSSDECMEAILKINERWRKAYEDLVRRRTIKIIVNNDPA